jgi:hypothetical protein
MVQARELPQKWADFFTKIYGTNEKMATKYVACVELLKPNSPKTGL